jgi:hypothetical protein
MKRGILETRMMQCMGMANMPTCGQPRGLSTPKLGNFDHSQNESESEPNQIFDAHKQQSFAAMGNIAHHTCMVRGCRKFGLSISWSQHQ